MVNKVVAIPRKYVRNWIYPEMPAMVADLVISMDDKYLYFSTWLHGEVYQYDITDPSNAKFVSKVYYTHSFILYITPQSFFKLMETRVTGGQFR